MTAGRRIPDIALSWIFCAVLLGLGAAWIAANSPAHTEFEIQALAQLERLGASTDESTRVIVLGNSLIRNAMAGEPSFEDELRAAGEDVVVANLAGSGRRFDSYEPILDQILATKPDVLVLQIEVFANPSRRPEGGLAYNLSRYLGRIGDHDFLATTCPVEGEDRIDWFVTQLPKRFDGSTRWIDRGREFIARAAEQNIEVYLVTVPRSARMEEAAEPLIMDFERLAIERIGDLANVTTGPKIRIDSDEFYCDFSHLNTAGHHRFLRSFVPAFQVYLETIGAEE